MKSFRKREPDRLRGLGRRGRKSAVQVSSLRRKLRMRIFLSPPRREPDVPHVTGEYARVGLRTMTK